MDSQLNYFIAQQRQAELVSRAEQARHANHACAAVSARSRRSNLGRLDRYTATHLERIAAAGLELQMIQANQSHRLTSERAQHTGHKYGSHSVSLLALKPAPASRHTSDPSLGGGARVTQATREEGPIDNTTTPEVSP